MGCGVSKLARNPSKTPKDALEEEDSIPGTISKQGSVRLLRQAGVDREFLGEAWDTFEHIGELGKGEQAALD
eukprot:CAMPEP_0118955192 /NCGR_PEP_ID=MMETSP1169-20130426/59598_1 /TAXON_ID=36882 /ORGANISM="Pyramimonas obovata, Strain CCMP722" /LENGTH=71 /DNA_ID=CAMNT_0006902989 /DNA_START=420 /DNA_END=632 /DNA_ORIENTATION=-